MERRTVSKAFRTAGVFLLSLVMVYMLVPAQARVAQAADTADASSDSSTAATTALSSDDYAAIAEAESDGTCAPGQALVVYHASGAVKGATGALSIQSDSDPLASAGFSISDTWDLSAADGVVESSGATSDGALSVQSETGSALASGSDVRVALVERDDLSTADLIASLESLSYVECAQPNYTHELCSLPFDPGTTGVTNDPLYNAGLQYGLSSATAGIGYGNELAADAATTSTVDNIVAVIDSGVDYTNPDLKDHMWVNPGNIGLAGKYGYDFYDNDDDPMPAANGAHGTHCAGLVAATTNNATGMSGVAQHTKIMACKGIGDNGDGSTDKTIAAAYAYILTAKLAGQNVVAVSNSWHIGAYCPVLDYLVNQAGKAGIVTFFAASNAGRDTVTTNTGTTADLQSPYAIVVASSNSQNTLSSFSNYNATAVDVAAPGSAITSTVRTSDATKGVTQEVGYNPTLALLTGKTPTYSKWFGTMVKDDGTPVDGVSITLMHQTLSKVWETASAADQQHLSCAKDSAGVGNRLKLTIKDFEGLSDQTTLNNYRVQITWSDTSPFYNQTVTPSDYLFGIGIATSSSGTDTTTAAFTLSPFTSERALAYMDKDNSLSENGTISAIDTTAKAMTCTANFYLTSTATSGNLVGYAESAAIDKKTDTQDYACMSGTSMATPMLAGCYAELASLYPNYTALQLRGLICGGTEQLTATNDSSGAKKQTASDGRFTFAKALKDSTVNANTWSISTSGTSVTVHGYNLNRATLTVDGKAVTPAAQSAGEIVFTADGALFDGASHRFDVTDTGTGRTYQASYVVPRVTAASTTLVQVGALPASVTGSSTGSLVAAADRLFLADSAGDYLYSTTDPSSGSWTELKGASTVLTGLSGTAAAKVRYAYADGKLYAFAGDFDSAVTKLNIYGATYDIAKGIWSASQTIGSIAPLDSPLFQTCAYASGGDVCFFATSEGQKDYVFYASGCTMLRKAEGSDTFTQVSVPIDTTDNVQGIAGMYKQDSTLYCLTGDGNDNTLNTLAYDGTSWTSKGALAGEPTMTRNQMLDQMKETAVMVGNGVFKIGPASYAGVGDASLLDPVAKTWTGLGSLLGTSTAQITVTSGAMMDGKVYLSGLAPDGTPTLYTLPTAAASKVATTDVVETAAASDGGTATVSDWRDEASSALTMREGDTATWTAVAAEGYTFAGWYDASGNKVSGEATYAAAATASQMLTARFTAAVVSPTPTPTVTSAAAASDSDSGSTGTTSGSGSSGVKTGDSTVALVLALLALLAGGTALAIARRRNDC